jgi:LacI family transcriptional regulator
MSQLRTLAASLGLSVTTVSRALDNYPDVSVATRERVRRAAEEVGYRPNAAARRLRRGTSEIVSLVLPTAPGRFNEPLYIELMRAMGETLVNAGIDLTLMASEPGDDELRVYRRLVSGRRVDGIIVVRTRVEDPRIAFLVESGFPFVVMGRTETPGPFPFVDGDGAEGFAEATRYLIRLGHLRIIHIAAPSEFMFSHFRRAGYERAMLEAGLPARVIEATADEEGGFEVAITRLAAPEAPTAILCSTDRIAFGVMRAVHSLGLSIPDDVSVIGHDNLPACAYSFPPLTTMELPLADTGRILAEMLLARIEGADPTTMQSVRPVRLIERGSVAPPRH